MKEKMNLKFAFAVNNENNFEKNHFGDTEKFQIYEMQEDKMVLSSEIKNTHKDMEHGTKNKGELIANLLKEDNVNVLVSMQFGKNIKVVNKHFIPVIIYTSKIEEIINILTKHIHWIEDEWNNNSSNYKLFTIKSGIIKSKINKNKI